PKTAPMAVVADPTQPTRAVTPAPVQRAPTANHTRKRTERMPTVDPTSATLRVAARPGDAGAIDPTSATLRVAARPGDAGAIDPTSATLRVAARPGDAGAIDPIGAAP